MFGPAKQGAQVGRFKGIRTLQPLLATLYTPTERPVIAAVRLRQGKAADSRGAKRLVRLIGGRSPARGQAAFLLISSMRRCASFSEEAGFWPVYRLRSLVTKGSSGSVPLT